MAIVGHFEFEVKYGQIADILKLIMDNGRPFK